MCVVLRQAGMEHIMNKYNNEVVPLYKPLLDHHKMWWFDKGFFIEKKYEIKQDKSIDQELNDLIISTKKTKPINKDKQVRFKEQDLDELLMSIKNPTYSSEKSKIKNPISSDKSKKNDDINELLQSALSIIPQRKEKTIDELLKEAGII